MATDSREVEYRITVDSTGAVTGIRNLGEEQDKLKGKNENAQQSFSAWSSTLTGLNQGLELAGKAFNFLGQNAGRVIEILERGSAVDDVAQSFQAFSEKAGAVSDVLLGQLQQATANTINDFDLMKESVESMRAGVKPDEFLELARAARVVAEETGGNLTDELQSLTSAMETGRVQALKNKLGVIDLDAALDNMARSLGKERDELTKEQEVLAARSALMEAASKKADEFSKVQIDMGDAIGQVKTALDNGRDAFARSFADNQELIQLLSEVAEQISQIDWARAGQAAAEFSRVTIDALREIMPTVEAVIDTIEMVPSAIEAAKLYLQGFDAQTAKTYGAIIAQQAKAEATTKTFEAAWKSLGDITVFVGDKFVLTAEGLKKAEKAVKEMEAASRVQGVLTKENAEKLETARRALDNYTKLLPVTVKGTKDLSTATGESSKRLEEIAEFEKKYAEALKERGLKMADLASTSEDYKRIMKEVEDGTISQQEAQAELTKILEESAIVYQDIAIAEARLEEALQSLGRGNKDAAAEVAALTLELERLKNGMAGASAGGTIGGPGGLFGDLFGDSEGVFDFGSLFDFGDIGSGLGDIGGDLAGGGGIFGAIAGQFKKVADQIGTDLASVLFAALDGKSEDVKKSVENLFSDLGGQFLFGDIPFLSDIGSYVGDQIGGAIFDAFDHVFGGEHPDTSLRKEVSRWFGELLEGADLDLIINGQRARIEDLFFNDELNGGPAYNWSDQLGLTDADIAGFNAAADALESIGGFELPDDQLGAVLSNNLENLNNLQIMLKATGFDAETFGKALEQAYLKGSISADQFLSDQAAIQDLFAEGIPGAVGATLEAFRKYIEEGLLDGAHAWDGLKDIAAEAIEDQMHSLDELRNSLIDQGASVEDVNLLWAAFAANGIDSLEELLNLSLDQTAAITSWLTAHGFAFSTWEEEARNVTDILNDIPGETNVDLNINIKTTPVDDGAKDLVKMGYLGTLPGGSAGR